MAEQTDTIENQTPGRARVRYLAANVVAWLAVFVGGLCLLFVLRHYGQDFLERQQAESVLVQAHDQYRSGDAVSAEQTVADVLDQRPTMAGYVVREFGMDILGLPQVYRALSDTLDTDDAAKNFGAERPQAMLILSKFEAGQKALESGTANRSASRQSYLLLGRLLMNQGRFEAAQRNFAQYWKGYSGQRHRLYTAALKGNGARAPAGNTAKTAYLAEKCYHLLWVGLWDEAIDLAATDSAKPDDPALRFFKALHADLAGQHDDAVKEYKTVLKERPNHFLSRARLGVLSASRS